MNMLVETLSTVGTHPAAWACVALVAALAAHAAWVGARCPYVRGTVTAGREEALARTQSPYIAGPGYALVILAGIALMVTGLAMMARAVEPVLAFAILAAGIVVVQVAPARLRLSEGYDRVIAAELQGPDAVAFARERLRDLHKAHVAMTGAIAVLLAAGLVAF